MNKQIDRRSHSAWAAIFTAALLALELSSLRPQIGNLRAAGQPSGRPELGIDASLNGRRPFPWDNPWNQRIDTAPVDPNSSRIIDSIGLNARLHPDFGSNPAYGIPYIVVSGSAPMRWVVFEYGEESDQGPYALPDNAPIEGGSNAAGDRHVIVVDRDHWRLYELFGASKRDGQWYAGSGAIFDLNSNDMRPAGWTSADAAGLPIFPGLARFDEVRSGEIDHALRFTAPHTRRAYIYPARHLASRSTDANLPAMGTRVRLKASVDISGFPSDDQVILRAMKRYGMILADNGSPWFFQGAPDSRWNDGHLNALKRLTGKDFEVVRMGPITTG